MTGGGLHDGATGGPSRNTLWLMRVDPELLTWPDLCVDLARRVLVARWTASAANGEIIAASQQL